MSLFCTGGSHGLPTNVPIGGTNVPTSRLRSGEGEADGEPRPSLRAIGDVHGSAHALGQLADDSQADSHPPGLIAPGVRPTVEEFEHMVPVSFVD